MKASNRLITNYDIYYQARPSYELWHIVGAEEDICDAVGLGVRTSFKCWHDQIDSITIRVSVDISALVTLSSFLGGCYWQSL